MTNKTKTDNQFQIIKSSKSKSLKNYSLIGYNVLKDSKNTFYIQLHSNSGSGIYSSEPVLLDEIIQTLQQVKDQNKLSGKNLHQLFRGRSSNSAGFLMCVLRDLKIVKHVQGKQRYFELMEIKPVLDDLKSLRSTHASAALQRKKSATRRNSKKKTKKKTTARKPK